MPATCDVPGIEDEDQQWRGIGPFWDRNVQIWSFRFHLSTFNYQKMKNIEKLFLDSSLSVFSHVRRIERDISTEWISLGETITAASWILRPRAWWNEEIPKWTLRHGSSWLMENKMSSIQLKIYRTSYENNSKNTLVELREKKTCVSMSMSKRLKKGDHFDGLIDWDGSAILQRSRLVGVRFVRPSGLGCLTCDLRRLLTGESPNSLENIWKYQYLDMISLKKRFRI